RELGDAWYGIAEKLEGLPRKQVLIHSKFWLDQCVAKLDSAVDQTQVRNRLQSIANELNKDQKVVVDKAPPPPPPMSAYDAELRKGLDYMNMKDYENAIKHLTNALRINPQGINAKSALNTAQQRLKEQKK